MEEEKPQHKHEFIKVNIRVRPLNEEEHSKGLRYCWDIPQIDTLKAKDEFKMQIEKNRSKITVQEGFNFDKAYDHNVTNYEIYDQDIKPIILKALEGENGTVFLYGQTGAGKTFTMIGETEQERLFMLAQERQKQKMNRNSHNRNRTPIKSITRDTTPTRSPISSTKEQPHTPINQQSINSLISNSKFLSIDNFQDEAKNKDGILSYSLKDIFNLIKTKQQELDCIFTVYCNYFEVYNEKIYDLLTEMPATTNFSKSTKNLNQSINLNSTSTNNQGCNLKKLDIQINKQDEFEIKNIQSEVVETVDEIQRILDRGEQNRHYANTKLNHHSSRSHTVFQILLSKISNNSQHVVHSTLNFVDLAGSESVSIHDDLTPNHIVKDRNKMNEKTKRQQESKNINKSLLNLNLVISKKAEREKHIPYRDSVMTKILKSSLGGNHRTLVICCLNPSFLSFDNSFNTIKFGLSAKKIQNSIKKNMRKKKNELQQACEDIDQKINFLNEEMRNSQCSELRQSYTSMFEQLKRKKTLILENNQKFLDFREQLGENQETAKKLGKNCFLKKSSNSTINSNNLDSENNSQIIATSSSGEFRSGRASDNSSETSKKTNNKKSKKNKNTSSNKNKLKIMKFEELVQKDDASYDNEESDEYSLIQQQIYLQQQQGENSKNSLRLQDLPYEPSLMKSIGVVMKKDLTLLEKQRQQNLSQKTKQQQQQSTTSTSKQQQQSKNKKGTKNNNNTQQQQQEEEEDLLKKLELQEAILEQYKSKVLKYQTENQQLKSTLQETEKNQKETLEKLEQQKQEQESTYQQTLQQQEKQFNEANQELQQNLQQQQGHVKKLQKDLNNMTSEKNQIDKFNKSLQQNVKNLTEQNTFLKTQNFVLSEKMDRLEQIVAFYQNCNNEGLMKLDLEFSQKAEVNCLELFQNIKMWQAYLLTCQNLEKEKQQEQAENNNDEKPEFLQASKVFQQVQKQSIQLRDGQRYKFPINFFKPEEPKLHKIKLLETYTTVEKVSTSYKCETQRCPGYCSKTPMKELQQNNNSNNTQDKENNNPQILFKTPQLSAKNLGIFKEVCKLNLNNEQEEKSLDSQKIQSIENVFQNINQLN